MVPPPRGLMPPPRQLMPYPGLLHSEPLPLLYSTVDQYICSRHSDTVLAQYLWGLWVLVAQGLSEPSNHLWRVWSLILNVILPLLLSFWGFFFALWYGVYFFGGTQHSPVDCSAEGSKYGVLAKDECTYFYSAILKSKVQFQSAISETTQRSLLISKANHSILL